MLIDTHCHLNFNAFKNDTDEVIKRAHRAGVTCIINLGSQWDTSERAVKLAQEHDNLYAAIGLHPIHLFEQEVDEEEIYFKTRAEVFNPSRYSALARGSGSKVVAIGECGLDYYRFPDGVDKTEVKTKQQELFRQHITLADELNLPVIIHCREAYDDLLMILKQELDKGRLSKKGVAHCFLGTQEQAKQFLDLGFLLSFTGIITFKNASPGLLKVVKETPIDRIMVETDAPYLAPQAYRGTRNEPAYIVEVAKKIAELKNISLDELARVTTQNARNLFSL
ncbi:MAG: TatD family hydrolase [Patescibacteria group bacterium]